MVIAHGANDRDYETLLMESLTHERRLDRGNAQVDVLSRDFGRFGSELWPQADALDARSPGYRTKLGGVMAWRNAIAHDDIAEKLAVGKLVPACVDLATCQVWRRALDELATTLDRVAARQCEALGNSRPW